jgi:hypothetical protein
VPGDKRIEFTAENGWNLPPGSVVVKHFALEVEKGNPATARRLETRLMHNEHDHWRGYTYVWNDEQTDAVLLEDPRGRDQTFTVKDPGGAERKQTWHYPSRAECTLCHTMPANFLLGVSTAQMDRELDYGSLATGPTKRGNQIRELEHLGLFSKPVADAYKKDAAKDEAPKPVVRLVDPHDVSQPLEARARSYLHANCSHCHMRSGGGNSNFEVPMAKSLADTRLLNAPPMHGDFGLAGAALLAPGDPDRSVFIKRMTLPPGPGRMPLIASGVVDEEAVKLMREWVAGMKR